MPEPSVDHSGLSAPVFLLTGEYPPRVGGIADYTARLAEALTRAGVNVTVLLSENAPLPSSEEIGVSVERIDASLSGWGLLPAVKQRMGGREAILHIQYQTAAFGMHPAINLLPRFLKLSSPLTHTVVTCHDVRVPYLFPKAGPVRGWVNRFMIDACDASVFSDASDRAWAGARESHWLIPIGSGVPVSAPPPEPAGADASTPFRIGYFGFLNSTKGLDVALEAVRRLVEAGRDLELLFIGDALGTADVTNAATRASVQECITRLGLGAKVRETGRLDLSAVSAALMACDVMIFPFQDGASFRRSSLAAALAHGRPVVTTLRPDGTNGIPGFNDGESAVLVPSGDGAAMARALERLMDEPHWRAAISMGAIEAARILEWPSIAEQTIQVYEQVLRKSITAGVLA